MRKFLLGLFIAFNMNIWASENGFLGISVLDFDSNIEGQKVKGVSIKNVFDESAAQTYGMHENDVIVKINDTYVTKSSELVGYLKSKLWGDEVVLTYYRGNTMLTQKVFLGYKKNQKKFKVTLVSSDNGNEKWFFADEGKYFYVSNNQAEKLTKAMNGIEETIWQKSILENSVLNPEIEDKTETIVTIHEKKLSDEACVCKYIVILKNSVDKQQATEINADNISIDKFEIFPNPSNGKFTIKWKQGDVENHTILNVFDAKGSLIMTKNFSSTSGDILQVDLGHVAQGTYLVQIKAGNETVNQQLVIM